MDWKSVMETAENNYQQDYVYLNDYTMIMNVEDISGATADNIDHYESNCHPELGFKATPR